MFSALFSELYDSFEGKGSFSACLSLSSHTVCPPRELQATLYSSHFDRTARRSDLIESLHDGSFFSEPAKLWVFLPASIVFAILWFTGIYLFFQPYIAKRKKRLRKQSESTPEVSW